MMKIKGTGKVRGGEGERGKATCVEEEMDAKLGMHPCATALNEDNLTVRRKKAASFLSTGFSFPLILHHKTRDGTSTQT